ncbi:hypothetical protein BDL97_03G074600 [Sphagnum fallax]|nr:hypothetical protein BDL97_03G074600 [Sphagnum fallax]
METDCQKGRRMVRKGGIGSRPSSEVVEAPQLELGFCCSWSLKKKISRNHPRAAVGGVGGIWSSWSSWCRLFAIFCCVCFLQKASWVVLVSAQESSPSDDGNDSIPASPQEVVALLAMKHAFQDPRQELRSWNESGFGACSGHWAGIKCAQGQVIAVTLPNKALAGSLATQVGELASLRKLNLHNNLLGGELPTSLVNLQSLRGLYLFRNNFSGVLPTGLGSSSPLLQALDLSYNHFSGPIPDSVSQAPKLLRLDLSNNRFNGTLPAATWGVESQLQYLNVSSNLLSGSIPATLGNASTALTSLDLSHNNFSGSIPPSFSHLTSNLTSFNVSYNSLSGVVPSLPHNFSSSAFIGNPGLCGYNGLPPCIRPVTTNAPAGAPPLGAPAAEAPALQAPAAATPALASAASPAQGRPSAAAEGHHKGHRLSTVTLICVALGSALAGVAVVCCILLLLCRKERIGGAGKATAAEQQEQQRRREPALGEGAGLGKLVHFDGAFVFTAEDLLGATAVVLGKSSYGTVYKATLENGKHIAVKRLREGIVKPQREFESEVKTLGRIRHPNLLALRAYYWGPKDEKLLVFDFVEGGTLAAFLHGALRRLMWFLWWVGVFGDGHGSKRT